MDVLGAPRLTTDVGAAHYGNVTHAANIAVPGAGPEPPDISGIAVEDGAAVDNIYSEKQQRLLTEPLYTGWTGPGASEEGGARTFFAAANVGVFGSVREPPLVPDVLLATDVAVHEDFAHDKRHGTYFVWEMGKPPDVVIEIVSNREGDELGKRRRGYARFRVAYYVVWDPIRHLGADELMGFELHGDLYVARSVGEVLGFASVGLGLRVWDGEFEGAQARWLRWCTPDGALVPTGAERAAAETRRADAERERADSLVALLRAHGIDPERAR